MTAMTTWHWLLLGLAAASAIWLLAVGGLMLAGRRGATASLVTFVPDCAVLFKRLVADPRLPRRTKLVLALAVAYLLMPLDLVPDFIPVAGQLDDVVVVAAALRHVVRIAGSELVTELWPGPRTSLAMVLRLALGRGAPPR